MATEWISARTAPGAAFMRLKCSITLSARPAFTRLTPKMLSSSRMGVSAFSAFSLWPKDTPERRLFISSRRGSGEMAISLPLSSTPIR